MNKEEMMEKVEAYKCQHCSMISLSKASVIRHEKRSCRKNMDRATCLTCDHWVDNGTDSAGEGLQYHEWSDVGCELNLEPGNNYTNENTRCTRYAKIKAVNLD